MALQLLTADKACNLLVPTGDDDEIVQCSTPAGSANMLQLQGLRFRQLKSYHIVFNILCVAYVTQTSPIQKAPSFLQLLAAPTHSPLSVGTRKAGVLRFPCLLQLQRLAQGQVQVQPQTAPGTGGQETWTHPAQRGELCCAKAGTLGQQSAAL